MASIARRLTHIDKFHSPATTVYMWNASIIDSLTQVTWIWKGYLLFPVIAETKSKHDHTLGSS